jgi:hypothetical protein
MDAARPGHPARGEPRQLRGVVAIGSGDAPGKEIQFVPILNGGARWAAAVVLVLGPLLQVVEFVLEYTTGSDAERVAFWAANPERVELGMAAGMLAVPFLLYGTAVLVALTRETSKRFAWSGGALVACAMIGLGAAHGYELAAYGLVRSGNPVAAIDVLGADAVGLPGIVFMLMFLGAASLGIVAMSIAVWRSPLLPRIVAPCLIAFAILDFAVQGQGLLSHVVNLIGLSIAAVAVVLGYSRRAVRTPAVSSEWRVWSTQV